MRKLNSPALHLTVWASYISFCVLVNYAGDIWGTMYEGVISHLISAAIFYANALWLLPSFYEKKEYKGFLFFQFLLWGTSIGIRYIFVTVIDPVIFHEKPSIEGVPYYRVILIFSWQWYSFILYSTGYWFANKLIKMEIALKDKEIDQVKLEKLELENEALRAQINPHFLFNTLGSFRNQVENLSPELGRDMGALMNIMESAIAKTGSDGMITFKQEIETIESFISIYKRRFPNINLSYSKVVPNNIEYRILPHVLMAFVENAFKHGAYYDPEKSIVIRIKEDRGDLLFAVSNKKCDTPNDSSVGIGIPLIKRHLDNGYGDRQELIINDDEEDFSVFLRIKELDRINARRLKPVLQG